MTVHKTSECSDTINRKFQYSTNLNKESAKKNYGVDTALSRNNLAYCQQLQTQGNPLVMNLQGSLNQNQFGQPMQQDPSNHLNQPIQIQQSNTCPQNLGIQSSCFTAPTNPYGCSTTGPSQVPSNGQLSQSILDQLRTTFGNMTPIFVLPNNQPNVSTQSPQTQPQAQVQQQPQMHQQPQMTQAFNQMPFNYLPPNYPQSVGFGPNQAQFCYPLPCYPYPFPLPMCEMLPNQSLWQKDKNTICNCCHKQNNYNASLMRNTRTYTEENSTDHCCCPGPDGTICTKSQCPSSINLQALVSQLLSIEGIIPCAAIRLALKQIPGSNITTSAEETMGQALRAIDSLNKEQLSAESRNSQQVNALINLHMISNPPANVIPILTMIQLKVNGLKAQVEKLIAGSVTEHQCIDGSINTNMDSTTLEAKSDAEIRQLLSSLRDKQCEERVNLNYAPYHSQRVITESRLHNLQSTINRVEAEMERRRNIAMPWNSTYQARQGSILSRGTCYTSNSNEPRVRNLVFDLSNSNEEYESPNPFSIQSRNPKRLNLSSNVNNPVVAREQCQRQTRQYPCSVTKDAENNIQKINSEPPRGLQQSENDTGQPRDEMPDIVSKNRTKSKRKLHLRLDENGIKVDEGGPEDVSNTEFLNDSSNVVIIIDKGRKPGPQHIDESENHGTQNGADVGSRTTIQNTDPVNVTRESLHNETDPDDSMVTITQSSEHSSMRTDSQNINTGPRVEEDFESGMRTPSGSSIHSSYHDVNESNIG